MTVVLKGFIVLPDDNQDEIVKALDTHIALTRQEKGCLAFEITPDSQNPKQYWVYEAFVDKDAFDAHQARVRSSAWGAVSADVERHYEPLLEMD